MAGRGGAAECQLHCCNAPLVFSQSTMSEIESFRATLAALRAALPLARQFPLREPSEGPLCRRPAPPEALQGASERRELSVKARFAHRRQAPRAAPIYIAATAGALVNQAHEQLRRTERYMWVLVAWPGVAVRPNASFIAGAQRIVFSQSMTSEIESFRASVAALRAALPHARRFPLREPSERLRRRRPAPPEAMQGA